MALNITSEGNLRGFLVGVKLPKSLGFLDIESSLEELGMLADTAGIHVVGQTFQQRKNPNPATFIGKGKVEEIIEWVEELEADIVIFDDELSPRHQRELEKRFGDDVQIIDRTALILDIFAQHANTREGALQVSLAQYEYRLPRLTRQWTHLARQAGGGSARGGAGGVGLRGPGETQLETDRREIGRKISHLKKEIEQVREHRKRHRVRRRQSAISVIALVGYTNAGKSTLLNRLSGASVYVADQLFATLDPTTRKVSLPSGVTVLFTDTVGFIQKLPPLVVAAFRATLEEISEADLIIHVVDASHVNMKEQISAVEFVLSEDIGVDDSIPTVVVFNKSDLIVEAEERDALTEFCSEYGDIALVVSALEGSEIDSLLSLIEAKLDQDLVVLTLHIPYKDNDRVALFHEKGIVLEETYKETFTEIKGKIAPQYVHSFSKYRVEVNL